MPKAPNSGGGGSLTGRADDRGDAGIVNVRDAVGARVEGKAGRGAAGGSVRVSPEADIELTRSTRGEAGKRHRGRGGVILRGPDHVFGPGGRRPGAVGVLQGVEFGAEPRHAARIGDGDYPPFLRWCFFAPSSRTWDKLSAPVKVTQPLDTR